MNLPSKTTGAFHLIVLAVQKILTWSHRPWIGWSLGTHFQKHNFLVIRRDQTNVFSWINDLAKFLAQDNRNSFTVSSMCSMRQSFSIFSVDALPDSMNRLFFSISGINWCSRWCRMTYVSFDEKCCSLASRSGIASANRDGQKLYKMNNRFDWVWIQTNLKKNEISYYSGVIFESKRLMSSSEACGNSPHW